MKILEIGVRSVLVSNSKAEVVFCDLSQGDANSDRSLSSGGKGILGFLKRLSKLEVTSFDVIVIHGFVSAIPRARSKAVVKALARQYLGIRIRRLAKVKKIPLVLIDQGDWLLFNQLDLAFIEQSVLVLKRELGVDILRSFEGTQFTGASRLGVIDFHLNSLGARNIDKIFPMPLGFGPNEDRLRTLLNLIPNAKKTESNERLWDVCFIGAVEGRPLRAEALQVLKELEKERAMKILIVSERLEFDEYVKILLDSHFCLSPSGFGWDCYRHYEAAICGAIPIMNYPDIRRWAPLLDGKHCLLYDPDEGVRGALDRSLDLQPAEKTSMRRLAKERAMESHSREGISQYALQEIEKCLSTPR